MSIKHGLLGLLTYKSMTRDELVGQFKGVLKHFWTADSSQIFYEIDELVKHEWITYEIKNPFDQSRMKLYRLTDLGEEELMHWLIEPNKEDGKAVKHTFLMKLFFSGKRSIDDNIAVLERYKDKCQKTLDVMNGNMRFDKDDKAIIEETINANYWKITMEFGYRYYVMCIEWADSSIDRLERMREKNY